MATRHDEIASSLPPDLSALPRLHGFRLRGLAMTRLETFIDAAFAFAITTLVIAAQKMPGSIEELLAAFRNVPTFLCSIAVIWIFWRGHWLWSRRYGLEDGPSILISWSLLVTVLIYIYPLRAVYGAMWFSLTGGAAGQRLGTATAAEYRSLFAAFAIGFSAMAFEILLLNFRAWQLREPLRLDARERLLTLGQIRGLESPDIRRTALAGARADAADRAPRLERMDLFLACVSHSYLRTDPSAKFGAAVSRRGSDLKKVAGEGIEPPTRGFSVLCSTN